MKRRRRGLGEHCELGYEVMLEVPGLKSYRSIVFTKKKIAREYRNRYRGAKMRAVKLCGGKIVTKGKRWF